MRTTTYSSELLPRLGTQLTGARSIALRLWHGYVDRVRRRATERALAGLSDQTLRDIGLHRSEISSVARLVTDDRYPQRH